MDLKASSEAVDTAEILSCVAGTNHRIEIISTLADAQFNLRELSDRLGVPRTTLRHNLEQLEEHGLVNETLDRSYALTPLGKATLSGLEAFRSRVQTEARLEPLFSCIDPSTFDFDTRALQDADITVAQQAFPHLPGQTLLDAMKAGQSVSAVLPSVLPLDSDDLEKLGNGHDTRLDLTLTTEVAAAIRQQFSIDLVALDDEEQHTVRVTTEDLPYGLVVIDERAYIQGFDDGEKPHVLVETDDPCCREWVEVEISSCRSEATRLTEAEV